MDFEINFIDFLFILGGIIGFVIPLFLFLFNCERERNIKLFGALNKLNERVVRIETVQISEGEVRILLKECIEPVNKKLEAILKDVEENKINLVSLNKG